VKNLRGTLGRFAPELLEYAREIWALFTAGDLQSESKLKGVLATEEGAADTGAVVDAIEDTRAENVRRELGRAD
jgi:RIO kinase 1